MVSRKLKSKRKENPSVKKISSQIGNSKLEINRSEKGMVLLDQTVIREEILGKCQTTLKKLDKAKKEIIQFENVDRPAYERWIHNNFGGVIEKIRSYAVEIEEKRAFIDEVQEEAFLQKITFIEAFQIIKYKKEHPEEFEKPKTKYEEEFEENSSNDEDDVFREDLNDFFRNFNSKFNFSEEEFESFKQKFKNTKPESNQSFDVRLKERYRLIAQKLHPDKNKKSSSLEKELWYEAQEAYKKKDLEKLDFIIALYNIKFGGIGVESSIFDLKFANSKLEKSLKQFVQKIKRAKHEPGWLFLKLKPKKLESLKKEAEKEFKDYERNSANELREINNILDKWERGSVILEKRAPVKKTKKQEEDDFIKFYVNF